MASAVPCPVPSPELKRLNIFVGKWDTEGGSCAVGEKVDDPLGNPLCPLRTGYVGPSEPRTYTFSRNTTAAFSLND